MQTDWTKLQSQTIDWLRFPMAAMVVVLHYSKTLILQADGAQKVLCLLFQEGLCRLAVPCFFFISGYLFFNKLETWDWNVWKGKIKKRGKTLLLPYILWNIIALIAYWLYENAQGNPISLLQEFSHYGGVRMFWSVQGGIPISSQAYPVDGPLWFIRDLIYFIIITPLIHLFVKWARCFGILALTILFLATNRIIPEGFLFFVYGAYLKISEKNIIEVFWAKRHALYLVSLTLLALLFFEQLYFNLDFGKKIVKFFFITSGIASSFCGAAWLLNNEKTHVIPFLAGSSFFIFAAHEVLILQKVVAPFVHTILPSGQGWNCLDFFIVPAFAICICLGLLYLLERLLPRTATLLTGNRRIIV